MEAAQQSASSRRPSSPAHPSSAIPLTASGLLIPRLGKDVPLTIYPHGKINTTDLFRQLVAVGALTPESSAATEEDLLLMGLDALIDNSGTVLLELNQYAESAFHAYSNDQDDDATIEIKTIGVVIREVGISYEMRLYLEPIIRTIGAVSPAWKDWLLEVICLHRGFGCLGVWSEIVSELSDSVIDHDTGEIESIADEDKDSILESRGHQWEHIRREIGAFIGYEYPIDSDWPDAVKRLRDAAAAVLGPHRTTHPEITAICDRLLVAIDRDDAVLRGYRVGEPLFTLGWEPGDVVDHAWDLVNHDLHEGNLGDMDDAFHCEGSIEEVRDALTSYAQRIAQPLWDFRAWGINLPSPVDPQQQLTLS